MMAFLCLRNKHDACCLQPVDHSYKHDQYWVGGVLPKLAQYKNTLFGTGQEFYCDVFFLQASEKSLFFGQM